VPIKGIFHPKFFNPVHEIAKNRGCKVAYENVSWIITISIKGKKGPLRIPKRYYAGVYIYTFQFRIYDPRAYTEENLIIKV